MKSRPTIPTRRGADPSAAEATNAHLRGAKLALEELKERCDEEQEERPDSSEAKIRSNMQSAMVPAARGQGGRPF